MTVGEIKDMIVVPAIMRFRKDIKQMVETAWLELSNEQKRRSFLRAMGQRYGQHQGVLPPIRVSIKRHLSI